MPRSRRTILGMPRFRTLRVGMLILGPIAFTAVLTDGLGAELAATLPASPQPTLLAPVGPEPALLIASPGEARIAWGEGRRQQQLRLPHQGRLSRVEATESEWIAAGTVAREKGRELLLISGDHGTPRQLPPPPGRQGAVRHGPVPMVTGGHLVGLAWLQGGAMDRLGVWAADWDGASWTGARQLAPPGPGSQLALSGAVLDDGSWLLAWSRHDGHDDEIYWSIRQQESWTEPRRAAAENDVPDILPVLVATDGGALLAWNHWDGEGYRLLISRWAGNDWSPPVEAGGRGSLFPAWRRSGSGAHLLFREAMSGSWEVLEVDAAGRLLRRASAAGPSEPAPVLIPAGETSLLFPDGRTEALSWTPVLNR